MSDYEHHQNFLMGVPEGVLELMIEPLLIKTYCFFRGRC